MKSSHILACAIVTAGAFASCVDLSPLPYSPPVVPDASVADAVVDVANMDALVAKCGQCLSSGPCASVLSACNNDVTCAGFASCMTATFCWDTPVTDLTHLAPCLTQCAAAGGITSQNGPGALLVAPLLECAHDPTRCGDQCAPSQDM
jgi:hypothetical protein